MKNSKLIFILTLMLMIISVSGVSATDNVDMAIDVGDSFNDGLNIQTVAVSDQSSESDIVTSGDGGNITPQTWEIDDSNYDTYFNLNDDYYPGIIREGYIKSGDTLKLGNITSKILYIDRTLTITSMSEDSVLNNSMIQLVAGSDNSVVSGLTVLIDYAQIPDISTQLYCFAVSDVNNISVKNNVFKNWGKMWQSKGGSYAMAIANVSNSIFTKNTIHSFNVIDENGTKQGDKTAIQITHSSNNIISYNDIQTNGANCIYFIQNSVPGIWTKPNGVSLVSVNNIIEYNTLNANTLTTNAMAWICQHMGGADNNTYRFNEICNGGIGITSSGGKGEICYNNTIYNVGTGIAALNNFTVYNNIINATTTGITAGGSSQIYNNIINVNSTSNGIGISVTGAMDGCLIKDNQISVTATKSANGIKVTKQSINGVISGNDIEVYDDANASVGINIGTTVDTAVGSMPNVTVSNNKITAQKIGIVLNKTVDSTVDGNIINLLNDDESYGIYVACSKATTAVAPNSINNVISNNRINARNGIKVGDANSKKAINTLKIFNNIIISDVTAIDIDGSVTSVSDVNISLNNITVNAAIDKEAYAIVANKVSDLSISKNTIDFTANTDGTVAQYAVSLAEIEGLVFDSNKIDAKLPSLIVGYDPITYAAMYSDLGFYLVDSNNAVINKNTFTVIDIKEGTGHDTLYNVYLKGDSNVSFTNNDVSILASVYTYAMKVEGYYVYDDDYETVYINSTNVNIKGNNIKSTSTGHYATGLEFGAPLDATISNNNLQVSAVDVAYGIYSSGYNGPINLMINNNKVAVASNSVYGVELYGGEEVTLLNNKINLNGNYTMGIASSSDVIEIIANEIIAKGANIGTPDAGDFAFGSDNVGIYVNEYTNKALISSNKISSSKYGVVVDCKEANIVENVIDIVGIAGNDTIGIKTSTKTNIIGNTITANGEQTYCELNLPVNTITGVLATDGAKVTAFNNKITTNAKYAIDLTDSCKDGFSQNLISNNKLVANSLVGDDSVTYAEGCKDNNLISDNGPIVVVITASNVVKTYKDSTKLVVTIKDNHGNIIAGKSITITIGKSTYTVTTDNSGKATLTLNQAVGTYSATIKVSGENYVTATKKVSIKVNKVSTTVTAKKVKVKKGAKKYFSVTIKNKVTGKSISGLTIAIKVYTGKKYKTYKVKTNSKGIAKISTKALKKGTHKVVISSSNKNYSVSKSGKLIVIR